MKRIFRVLLSMLVLGTATTRASEGSDWPFFAFDNGVGRGVWSAEVQADTLKKLGYDGISYNYTNPADFQKKLSACTAAGVAIHAVYVYSFVDQPDKAYDPGVKEVIRMLKGTDTIIWLTLRNGKAKTMDTQAASIVRDIATQANEAGLKVSLYPHAGFYVATAEDAVRVAKAVNMPNVGVTINLCHELFAGNANRLDEVVRAAGPHLNLVSINGASPIAGKGPKAWDTLPIGSGTFDVDGFLKLIKATGYRGPVGHQFYNVPGEDREKLDRAIRSWRDMKPRAQAAL